MSELGISVCGHRVLVLPEAVETVTEGGIVLAIDEKREEIARETGTVADVGPEAWKAFDEEPWATVGDKVVYSKYGGKFVVDPTSGVKYVVLNDEDILVRIKEGKSDA